MLSFYNCHGHPSANHHLCSRMPVVKDRAFCRYNDVPFQLFFFYFNCSLGELFWSLLVQVYSLLKVVMSLRFPIYLDSTSQIAMEGLLELDRNGLLINERDVCEFEFRMTSTWEGILSLCRINEGIWIDFEKKQSIRHENII